MRTFSYVILVIVALVIAGICLLFPNEVAELIDQTIEWGKRWSRGTSTQVIESRRIIIARGELDGQHGL